MNHIYFELENHIFIGITKYFFIILLTYITSIKFLDENIKKIKFMDCIWLFIVAILTTYVKFKWNSYIIIISIFTTSLSIILHRNCDKSFLYSMVINIISLSINFGVYIVSLSIVFFPSRKLNFFSTNVSSLFILVIYFIILLRIWKIKRLRDGINFLKMLNENYLQYVSILNLSIIILFIIILISNYSKNITGKNIILFFALAIVIFFEIKKSIEAYYKQKMLIKDLDETKKELEEKKKEVEELEKENLGFNKRSHSLAYKQKSLEFKLNKLLMKSEFADELGLTDEFKNISIQMKENEKLPKLDRTGIIEVDDMLDMMQEECRKNEIDFTLQLKGNIYQMTNNFIDKEDLATLLADHIKDAIIAINHTDNLNKSIMVRLGKIDECFAVYFYDSGVEFPEEIFNELGTGPITAYANEGGTGLGFMNTFDVLRKKNASLIVENLGKPSIDNYTKIIKIIFDNKNKIMFDKTKILW